MTENEERPGQRPRYLRTAAISAVVLLFAAAFFMAGFWTHSLVDEDVDLNPVEDKLTTLDGRMGKVEESLGGLSQRVASLAEALTGQAASVAAEDDPSWGPKDAAVTIEEFSDFQCPYCARFATQTLPKLKETYGDKVRFIFRDFPLTNIHKFAQKAAEAAQCAHEQGKSWEYHDLLFANQSALDVPDLKRYAGQVGLDMARFNDCLDSGKNTREVALDLQDGIRAGVTGTPAFLINGLLVSGAQPFEQFQAVIDQALAAGH